MTYFSSLKGTSEGEGEGGEASHNKLEDMIKGKSMCKINNTLCRNVTVKLLYDSCAPL